MSGLFTRTGKEVLFAGAHCADAHDETAAGGGMTDAVPSVEAGALGLACSKCDTPIGEACKCSIAFAGQPHDSRPAASAGPTRRIDSSAPELRTTDAMRLAIEPDLAVRPRSRLSAINPIEVWGRMSERNPRLS